MNSKEIEKKIIENYQKDEHMMILIFSQWCINNNLNPLEIYEKAYPKQQVNPALKQAIELTVPKEEAGDIANQTLLNILSLYGNEDLAFVVSEEMRIKEKS
ncbi:hypothetical protein [Metabacillus litoralis]|uniref:hypothetical protein n=1 Tax=Metabacillus litoralis TaxID=152268 RepID=UPI001CFEF8CC|nr:hypothetical protein [Metabacillus litoralis]